MQTLYQITGAYLQLLEMAQDPEIEPSIFADTLEAVEGDLEVKAEGYAIVDSELQTRIDGVEREIERLNGWLASMKNNKRRLREALMQALTVTGKTKLETEHFRIGIARNGGKQPMTISAPIEEIPEAYIIREPKVNTAAVREALEQGKELPFARLEERGQHLSIR